MQSTNYAYVNGRFVPESEATVSIFDRGFLYGDGVFETMRVYGGKIFRLSEHINRLMAGLELLQMGVPIGRDEICAIFTELIRHNKLHSGLARLYVTSGPGEFDRHSPRFMRPTVVALAQPLRSELLMEFVSAVTSEMRLNPSPFTRAKTANRLPYVLARAEATRAGVNDALLLNDREKVVEFSVSNIFVLKRGELWTPPLSDGPLPGITREVVMVVAAKLGIPTREVSFGIEFAAYADEIFATNSLSEIIPVIGLDGTEFCTHKLTERLRAAYHEMVREELGL